MYRKRVAEMPRLIVLLILGLCIWHKTSAQRLLPYSWEDFVTSITQEENLDEEEGGDEWLEDLKMLHENPLDINKATTEELLQVPTLTESAVEQIHAYIYLHGAVQSMGELRLIPGLTEYMLRMLPLFVCIRHDTATNRPKLQKPRPSGSVDYRTDIPLYYRKGYCVSPGYAGDPLYHRLRGEVEFAGLEMGIRMEKDPGERYYDSYGAYATLEKRGVLHKMIVGDYRIGYGQGLVVGSGSQWGMGSRIVAPSQGIRPMKGMDEYRFMRGAAAEMRFNTQTGFIGLTPFISWRNLDATLNNDGNVKTIRQDGLHRTQAEREAKGAFGHLALGGHLTWKYKRLTLGATGTWQHTSKPLEPGEELYRKIYPRGTRFGHFGTDYSLSLYRLQIAGEAAYSTERGGWATLHRLHWTPLPTLQVAAMPRFYSYRYHSFLASAPTASGNVPQNESGIMLRISSQPKEGFSFTTWADASYHPWPRYGIAQSSNIFRAQTEGEYTPSRQQRILLKYQWKRGMERGNVMRTHHQMQAQWEWTPKAGHTLRSTLLGHQAERRTGWGASCRWQAQFDEERWTSTLSATYFDTHDYLHRIWIYEPSLMGSMANGSLSGNGVRGMGKLRWKSRNGHWMIEAKLGATYRLDTDIQGSGLQTIVGRWKTDIGTLARFSF